MLSRLVLRGAPALLMLLACNPSSTHLEARTDRSSPHAGPQRGNVTASLALPPTASARAVTITSQWMSAPGEPTTRFVPTSNTLVMHLGDGHHHLTAKLDGHAPRRASIDVRDGVATPSHVAFRLDVPTGSAPDEGTVASWLRSASTSLADEPRASPLLARLAEADVVGLGEAVHGGEEVARRNVELVKALVTRHGFRALVVEGNYADTVAVDALIRGGSGDARAVVAGLDGWWLRSEAMLHLVAWARDFNRGRDPRDQLRFFGCDNQRPESTVDLLVTSLRPSSPALAARAETELAFFRAPQFHARFHALSASARTSLLRDVVSLQRELDTGASPDELAVFLVELLRQLVVDAAGAPGFRDRAMADNTLRLHRRGNGKTMVWAHNFHVSTDENQFEPSMGVYLRRAFGPRYLVVGSSVARGTLRAWSGDQDVAVDAATRTFALPAPRDALDTMLDVAATPDVLVDLREAPVAVTRWLRQPLPMHDVGTRFFGAESALTETAPAFAFDFLLHVSTVSPLRIVDDGAAR